MDVNKVETALKKAGVALRDSTGQFRNFDDVIMDLSSKWDTLDRNTQRYIATVAAGSRQQSRFIALVEDYDRNVELVNLAQNSAGASAAQFGTQLTGLEASVNRLQASWEALYLSFNEGPSLFSWLIDKTANLVQNLADLGLGATAVFAAIGVGLAQLVVKLTANTALMVNQEVIKQGAILTTAAAFNAQKKAALSALSMMGPYIVVVAGITAAVLALFSVVTLINRALNKHKIAAREAAEAAQEYEAAAGKARQEASSLEELANKYEQAYLNGEDLTDIQNELTDQYPELAKNIDFATDSYEDIIAAMKEYIQLKKIETAENEIKQSKEEKRVAEENLAQAKQENEKILYDYQYDENATMKNTKTGEEIIYENFISLTPEEKLNYEITFLIGDSKEVFRGTIEELQSELENRYLKAISATEEALKKAQSQYSLTEVKSKVPLMAQQMGIDFDNEDLVALMLYGITPEDFDENANFINEKLKDEIETNIGELSNISKQILSGQEGSKELQEQWKKVLIGDTSGLTAEIYREFADIGLDLTTFFPELVNQMVGKRTELDQKLKDYGLNLGVNYSNAFKQGLLTKLKEVEDDPELLNLYTSIFRRFGDGFEGLSEEIQNALNAMTPDTNGLLNAYTAIIDGEENLNEQSKATAETIKDELTKAIIYSGDAFNAVQNAATDFSNSLNDLNNMAKNGLSSEEFANYAVEYGLNAENLDYYDAATNTYHLTKEALKELLEARKNETVATYESLIAIEREKLETLENVKKKLENANGNLVLEESEYWLAEAINTVNKVMGKETIEIQKNKDERLELKGDIDTYLSQINEEISASEDQIAIYEIMMKSVNNASLTFDNATSSSKDYTKALKEQADTLKSLAEIEKSRIESEIEGIKKVLEARKKALEEENENLQKQIDQEKETQEILLQGYLQYLEKRKEEYQNSLDEMEKTAEEARELAEKNNEELTFQNQIAQDYYKDQISLIDEKINALNAEAKAEDRLQKLQEARDAYERTKNTKNRLVLVRGAGWVFKRNQSDLTSTYEALQDAQREVQIAKLNEEKDLLQEQADAWAEKAENIGKTTEELEKYNLAYEEFSKLTEEQRQNALQAFAEAVLRNNQLNQSATDKENLFTDQSDADKEGTLAWNIAKVEELSTQTDELIDKIGKSADELLKSNRIDEVVKSLESLLGEKGFEGLTFHLDSLTHGVNSYLENFLSLSNRITQNESNIESIDKALDEWNDLTDNLDKSQTELNKELEIFNRYNQLTIEQLSKNGEVYSQVAKEVSNLADQWDRVNAAQQAYEAANGGLNTLSISGEGYATGGVNTYTGLAAVHGTKSRPEVFLNNSQAGALFNFIDGLTTIPTLNKRRNIPRNIVATNTSTEDNSTNYNNCKFEVVSNENSINSLLQDVKNRSPLHKF